MKKKHYQAVCYRDKNGQYRYRVKASNGKIVNTPHESYKNKRDMLNIISSVGPEWKVVWELD